MCKLGLSGIALHLAVYATSGGKVSSEFSFSYFAHVKFAIIKIRLSLDFRKTFNERLYN